MFLFLGVWALWVLSCIYFPRHQFKERKWRKWNSLSLVRLFATPWTIQSMEFSRPEYWSGSLSLVQVIFPTQVSHIASGFFTSWATGGGGRGGAANWSLIFNTHIKEFINILLLYKYWYKNICSCKLMIIWKFSLGYIPKNVLAKSEELRQQA